MNLRKLMKVLLALALVAAVITACAPAAEEPVVEGPVAEEAAVEEADVEEVAVEEEAAADEPAELAGTLQISAPPWIIKKFPLEQAIERFMADHPGVTVELNAVDKWNVATYIAEWKQGETSVDLYVGGSGSMLAPVISGDWSEPLDDMLVDSMAPEMWVGGYLAAGKYMAPDGSGSRYPVLPFMGEVSIIGVNTVIAEKAGLMDGANLKPIPSFEEAEFLGWMQALADNSQVAGHVQIWDREFLQYNYCAPIIAMTGNCFTENGFDVSSDAAKQWLTLVQKMNETGVAAYTITDDEGYDKWKTNESGSFFAGQGHVMELVNAVTEDESSIVYTGWPGQGSVIWTHSVWIPRVAADDAKDLAKAFMREQIYTPFFSQWSFNNYGKLPVMKEHFGEGIERFQDQMPIILGVADASKPVPLYTDMEEYLDILNKYLPEAAFGRMSVEDALAAVQAETADLDFTDLRAP